MSQVYFAAITPGLEDALLEELRKTRVRKLKKIHGGVEFDATGVSFMEVMHKSRFAIRVALRVDSFRARDRFELFRKVKRIDWSRLLPSECDISVDVFTKSSKMNGTGEISSRIKDGILASWKKSDGKPPIFKGTNTDSQRITARFENNQCHLSLDASGELMHRRGWRLKSGEAPLRENIAAALLHLLGWEPNTTLFDPMCGSGTFLLEAARWATNRPPRNWSFPRYSFQRWSHFKSENWVKTLEAFGEPIDLDYAQEENQFLFGSDRDAAVLSIARENEKKAEVKGAVQWETRNVSDIRPPRSSGMMIANPPYGARLERKEEGKKGAERILLETFAKHFSGWTLGLLLPADFSAEHPALTCSVLARFRNGGRPVCFWKVKHKTVV